MSISLLAQEAPVLNTLFPAGAQAGTTVEVTSAGTGLADVRQLYSGELGIQSERLPDGRFLLRVAPNVQPGLYDLWAVNDAGFSAPRSFQVGNRVERIEVESAEPSAGSMSVPLNVVVNGRIDKPGDLDRFQFTARRGQRVVIECWAERIESRLRAVLELYDSSGRRLAANRGWFGIDPLIDFRVPDDGDYHVQIQDLTASATAEHYYRLDIDTGPRVLFSVPQVIERGKAANVTLVGWNLSQRFPPVEPAAAGDPGPVPGRPPANEPLDQLRVEIPASVAHPAWPLRVPMQLSQIVHSESAFPYLPPGAHAPILIGLSDVPIVVDPGFGSTSSAPLGKGVGDVVGERVGELPIPCEWSGQFAADESVAWHSISARRGEVLFLYGMGQRIASSVDLRISVFDAERQSELAQFDDDFGDGIDGLPTQHRDAEGRWVCPRDGRYWIAVRNLSQGNQDAARRWYRLGVRREEADFRVLAVPRRDGMSGLFVPRGGRTAIELLAQRQRGCDGSIRVTAEQLLPGLHCDEAWFGPGVDRTTIMLSADASAVGGIGELQLVAELVESSSAAKRQEKNDAPGASSVNEARRVVRGATVVRSGTPTGWARIPSRLPYMTGGQASLRISADAHQVVEHHLYGKLHARHSPGGIVDVAVRVERIGNQPAAPIRLQLVGLPSSLAPPPVTFSAGESAGYLSFYLPSTLPTGPYSFVVRADSSTIGADGKVAAATVYSNAVTIDLQPAAFVVELAPFTVARAKRGEVITVAYSCRRVNGFIGKMHTELAVPGVVTNVPGLRGRGETFVGQAQTGSLQIVVNEDAPLGTASFLRLFTVGVVEDSPSFFGGQYLPLEIVE
ncbi:MAG: hypothetical protein FJ295_00320 [Planctomycetes bacterium]|nr:hypothetical protein [Planctomycetota bacterium]